MAAYPYAAVSLQVRSCHLAAGTQSDAGPPALPRGAAPPFVANFPAPPAPSAADPADWGRTGEHRQFVELFNRVYDEFRAVYGDRQIAPIYSRGQIAGSRSLARRIVHSRALTLSQKIAQLQAYFREADAAAAALVAGAERSKNAKAAAKEKKDARKRRRECNEKSPAHTKRDRSRSPPPAPRAVLLKPKGSGVEPPKKRQCTARAS